MQLFLVPVNGGKKTYEQYAQVRSDKDRNAMRSESKSSYM